MMSSAELNNVHCLGCKKRHEIVIVNKINELSVKGSPRYQAKGTCENGKTWTKILNKNERISLADMMPSNNEQIQEVESVSKKTEQKPVLEKKETEIESVDISLFDDEENTLVIESDPIETEVQIDSMNDAPSSPPTEKTVVLKTEIPSEQTLNPVVTPQGHDGEGVHSEQRREIELEAVGLRSEIQGLSEEPIRRRNAEGRVSHRTNRMTETESVAVRQVKAERKIQISAEQSFKIGRHYGYNEASFSQNRYKEGLAFHFERSRVNPQFFDAFAQGYIEGGERYLLSAEYEETPSVEVVDAEPSISPRTTAGLAAVSIFGAWVASRINKRG